ncbi:5'-methylthioadenosine/S-adenosylhomocysteine nucleosidase [Acinetobacter qingfengensis]|uniref:5'-methylthioadenosine nucleosidase n=1 Tax=Acinetobacter qingfengensis TaxID=1262585 RepID=A0A1E7REG7_9GAMM|nr:5'-methylthioadenosine/S-adenosylhomocysteine nucleosidase [Acinetobacter qingfengensis]KAA8734768.1 5'-methylthioadenosine/S-adenosylhomocysteine nucleosidase [Acinetobacter qingfengensis]OEY97686.1 5'-methylthioadenosine nucleosidase [Acinetobacter qingfengensis]
MMLKSVLKNTAIVTVTLWATHTIAAPQQAPVVIQGALDIETDHMIQQLENVSIKTYGGWKFWQGTYKGYPIVISRTLMGMSNSAAATVLAIEHYRPAAIINQGTSGGHDPQLKVFDIVIGKESENIGAFITPKKALGEGSNSLTWNKSFNVLPKNATPEEESRHLRFQADPVLLAAAVKAKSNYKQGKVVEGVIGSADVWNNELDRIKIFHEQYKTSVEEMETASVAQVASLYNVPFIGIRVLSNNITNNGTYNPATGVACQNYALNVAVNYLATQK